MAAPLAVTAPTAMPGMPEVRPEITRTGFNFTTWLIIAGGLIAAGLFLRRYGAAVKEQ